MRRAFVALPAAVAYALAATTVHAECPAKDGASALSQVDVDARLHFLAWAFDREIRDVDIWSWSWGTTYVAGSAAQGIIAGVTHDHGLRVDLTVGSSAAGFGALTLFGLPLRVTLPLRDARRRWSEADRCQLLADAEATLIEVADRERMSSSWIPHVGNVALNVGIALLLGFGYHRWTSAAISGGVGIAVGEANVFSQPHRLPGLLERYRAGHIEEGGASAPSMALGGHGLGLTWAIAF